MICRFPEHFEAAQEVTTDYYVQPKGRILDRAAEVDVPMPAAF